MQVSIRNVYIKPPMMLDLIEGCAFIGVDLKKQSQEVCQFRDLFAADSRKRPPQSSLKAMMVWRSPNHRLRSNPCNSSILFNEIIHPFTLFDHLSWDFAKVIDNLAQRRSLGPEFFLITHDQKWFSGQ